MTSIRVDDLADPRLTLEQQGARDAFADAVISLDLDELVAKARRRTGLRNLGDQTGTPGAGVLERAAAYAAAVEADTGLHPIGRLIHRTRIVRLLENRLRLHELLARHPEIRDLDLPAPIIVVGLPRTGTTHLVNLLAEDPRRRALPFWESQDPFPVPGQGPGADGVDPRFRYWQDVHALEDATSPLTRYMHDRHPAAIEEEVELLDLDFASYTLEWHIRSPQWRDFYLGLDQDAHYGYLRLVLQALTYLRGPNTWVLKSPQHLEQLGPLLRTFPDATIAVTHRDPVAVIQSAVTMLGYADRMRRHSIDPGALLDYWVDRVERLLAAFERDRHLLDPDRTVDVVFADFMADQLGTVDRVYRTAQVELNDAVRDRFAAYIAAHPRGREVQIEYDLRAHFGADPTALSQRFAEYRTRYRIQQEVR